MAKKIILITLGAVMVIALFAGAINRTLAKSNTNNELTRGNGRGAQTSLHVDDPALRGESVAVENGQGYRGGNDEQGNGLRGEGQYQNLPPAGAALSATEEEALLYMREEEKLARDVYTALYAQWGLPIFQNIASSEQTHMDSILTLLQRYNLADPAQAAAGVFTNPTLQSLYTDLVARGSESLAAALRVGAAIEEIDILDLQNRLASVENADVAQVFQNLLQGSGNHLRSFVEMLERQAGEAYTPQYLSADAFAEILNTAGAGGYGNQSVGRGGNGRRGGGQ